MSSGKQSFSSPGNMAKWGLVIILIFVGVYLVRLFFVSNLGTGDTCVEHSDCRGKICTYDGGRKASYCTKKCARDDDCPESWKCLQLPLMPAGDYACLRP